MLSEHAREGVAGQVALSTLSLRCKLVMNNKDMAGL